MKNLINDYTCPSFSAGGTCYSCGRTTCKNKNCIEFCKKCKISQNDEHIPPQGLFKQNKGYPGYFVSNQNQRKISSCYRCNNSTSGEDDYFLAIITIHASNWNEIAKHAALSKRIRGIIRNEKLRQKMTNSKKDLKVYSMGNKKILGYIPHAVEIDTKKFDKINIKIIKGFYFKQFGKVLSKKPKFMWSNFGYYKDGAIYTDALNPEINDYIKLFEFNKGNKSTEFFFYDEIQSKVFSYGYIRDGNGEMIWLLNYYDSCIFFFRVNEN